MGKDAQDAAAKRLRKGVELNAVNKGVAVVPENGNGQRPLAGTAAEYLDEVKLSKKPKTHAAYSTALAYFVESCHKLNLDEVDRKDLLKFSSFLGDEKDQSPRSVYNKFENVMTFLKAQGIRGLVSKNDWPRFVEEEPEVYEKEELEKLFKACDPDEQLWYEFFLMTGMREQEVMHASWADVNLTRNTVTVRYKPEYGFSPKNYREREIPIPAKLVQRLYAWRMRADKNCGLLFPTAGCRPKLDFLDCLKTAAKRAKLKPKSTMRYLKPSRSQQVREKVNEIFE